MVEYRRLSIEDVLDSQTENVLNNVTALYNRINGRTQLMDLPEQRIVGSLILLAGVSFLAVGLYTDQLTTVTEILGEILKTAIAG